jgi:DnaJ-class molecular chaperone
MENENKNAAKNIGDAITSFGAAMGKIFNDPALKDKSRDLGKAIADSAETLGRRFDDPEVKAKFKETGDSMQSVGKNISDAFGKIEDKCRAGSAMPPFQSDNCHGCNGRGWVETGIGVSSKVHTCVLCKGTGKKQ